MAGAVETAVDDVAVDPWRRATSPPRLEPGPANLHGVHRWRLASGKDDRPSPSASPVYVLRVLCFVLIVAVLGQRFVLPLGATPIGVPLVAAYTGVLLLRIRGGLRYNRVRTELFLLAAGALLVVTWANTFQGSNWSLNSLLLLLVLYLPWVFCIPPAYSDRMKPLLRFYVHVMVAVALTAIGQMTTQLTGLWAYEDYVQTLVPPDWLAQGYNTSFPMTYNSPIYKANAFLFLEPSFLCQFLSLAILVGLLIKAPAWQLLLLGLGMACTLSGTGILLLVAGLVLLVLRYPKAIRPSYVIAGVLGLLVIFQTPAAPFLLDRRSETTQEGSSGYLRFIQPYTEVVAGLDAEPQRYVIGAGPGSADRLLESGLGGKGEAVVYTIAPKIAFEYGLAAGTVFVAFLLVSVLRGPPLRVLPGAMVVMTFFLSGSLLQTHTIVTAWMLTSIWGRPITLGMTDALAAWRRQHDIARGDGLTGRLVE
jgi:hypothetical protein